MFLTELIVKQFCNHNEDAYFILLKNLSSCSQILCYSEAVTRSSPLHHNGGDVIVTMAT